MPILHSINDAPPSKLALTSTRLIKQQKRNRQENKSSSKRPSPMSHVGHVQWQRYLVQHAGTKVLCSDPLNTLCHIYILPHTTTETPNERVCLQHSKEQLTLVEPERDKNFVACHEPKPQSVTARASTVPLATFAAQKYTLPEVLKHTCPSQDLRQHTPVQCLRLLLTLIQR